ncbi:MAG TPA: helix-turn-helix transcriptional regulator [Haloplasmataceae bacterium]
MEGFPQRLRKLRVEHGMLQRELAEKLNVSRVAITQYENGKRLPEWDKLQKIADIFGVSVDYLLGRVDDKHLSLTKSTLAAHRIDDPFQELPEEARRSLEEFQEYILRKYRKRAET